MRIGLTLQTAAAVAVLSCFLGAEVVSVLLNAVPSSPVLWFLTLEIFQPFDMAGSAFQSLTGGGLTLAWVVALLAAALIAHVRKSHVVVGLFAHLGLFYMIGVVFRGRPSAGNLSASLDAVPVDIPSGWLFFVLLLVLTAAGAVASHYTFLRRN